MKPMFPYSFGSALQESVVKIEFGLVVNPISTVIGIVELQEKICLTDLK